MNGFHVSRKPGSSTVGEKVSVEIRGFAPDGRERVWPLDVL
jgi:hypothetical protein